MRRSRDQKIPREITGICARFGRDGFGASEDVSAPLDYVTRRRLVAARKYGCCSRGLKKNIYRYLASKIDVLETFSAFLSKTLRGKKCLSVLPNTWNQPSWGRLCVCYFLDTEALKNPI